MHNDLFLVPFWGSIIQGKLRICFAKVECGILLAFPVWRCVMRNGHLGTVNLALECSVVHQQWTPCTHIGKVLYLDTCSCHADELARFCQSLAVSGMGHLMIHSRAIVTTSVMHCVKGLVSKSFHVRHF